MIIAKNYWQGFFKQAGRQIFNEAVNAAGQYIGNAIQEMLVVKKETEHPRILPSLEHMKIVSDKWISMRVIFWNSSYTP